MTLHPSSLSDPRAVPAKAPQRTVIEPTQRWVSLPLKELWQYRELLYFLVWRDLKVRYKQSVLGVLWIVVQPLITMVVFTLIFNRFLGIQSGSALPYPIFTYSALLPWTYFSQSLARSSTSLVGSARLISKVYFPRMAIPLAAVLPGLVDFSIGFTVLLSVLLFLGHTPELGILALPLALGLAVLTALGFGFWLSALHVRYRDVGHLTPFLLQLWLYATPVIYPISRIPERWHWLYSLNPMVGVVQSFRRVLLGDPSPLGMNWISIAIVLLIFFSGAFYFGRVERDFADVV